MSTETADEFDIALARNVATLTDAHLAEFEQTLRAGLPMRQRMHFDAEGDGNPVPYHVPNVRADHVLVLVVALRRARAQIVRLAGDSDAMERLAAEDRVLENAKAVHAVEHDCDRTQMRNMGGHHNADLLDAVDALLALEAR